MKISAKKIKMSQIFKEKEVVPVTIIEVPKKEDLSFFKENDSIKISGTSKGKGFQGVVKRWHFRGGFKTHGQKDNLRASGSIGATTPQRVFKGKKMAGRTGQKKITLKNLKIIKIDNEKNFLMIKGAIPGPNKAKLILHI